MAARRVLTISLPSSDPATAAIQAWLDGLPSDADVSSEVRRLLAGAIGLEPRLANIEAQLARLAAGGAVAAAPPAPELDADQAEALDALFDFGG